MPSGCKKRARKSASKRREQLRVAVIQNHLDEVVRLPKSDSFLWGGPYWQHGRTALHLAALNPRHKVVYALIQSIPSLTDLFAKDQAGFTPLDLLVNPLEFTKTKVSLQGLRESRLQLAHEKSQLFKGQFFLVYVSDTEQADRFITENPGCDRVGFIVDLPNVLKRRTDCVHVVPIYFQRMGSAHERFLFLDPRPATGKVKNRRLPSPRKLIPNPAVLIPLKRKEGVERSIFYCQHFRRANRGGDCFVDAMLDLVACYINRRLLSSAYKNSAAPLSEWVHDFSRGSAGGTLDCTMSYSFMLVLLSKILVKAVETAPEPSEAACTEWQKNICSVLDCLQGYKNRDVFTTQDLHCAIQDLSCALGIGPMESLFIETFRSLHITRDERISAENPGTEDQTLTKNFKRMDISEGGYSAAGGEHANAVVLSVSTSQQEFFRLFSASSDVLDSETVPRCSFHF